MGTEKNIETGKTEIDRDRETDRGIGVIEEHRKRDSGKARD